MDVIILIVVLMVVLIILNLFVAIWLAKKGFTKDENNNMIPDILEEKFAEIKADVSEKVERVGQELKDVSIAIKDVGKQITHVPKAFKGQKRAGKKITNK
mgnify:CR=1 FL=1|tara:strand:+ start:18264 stop:18563 length:300 start_codon:yes stop_codon:yes gene_type:complete